MDFTSETRKANSLQKYKNDCKYYHVLSVSIDTGIGIGNRIYWTR
jgi:hypothetical protein